MSSNVRRLILATVAAAIVSIAAAYLLFPVHSELGSLPGLAFWTVATLAASALPVRLPRGTVVSVAAAPMIAVMALGGPLAAAIVGVIGTTDTRELRGQVPWYGTLYNHASAAIAIVVGGAAFEGVSALGPSNTPIVSFIATLVGALLFFAVSWSLALAAVSARTGTSVRTVWAQDV
ncbi:MAG TPA: hypothetical protein VFO36_00020, partial [Nitrospiraceae bacterium]|nr:hypothetical protein [Nitrospiraceae bacterium]